MRTASISGHHNIVEADRPIIVQSSRICSAVALNTPTAIYYARQYPSCVSLAASATKCRERQFDASSGALCQLKSISGAGFLRAEYALKSMPDTCGMPSSKTTGKAAWVIGAALLLAAWSTAFADTTVRAAATEGKSDDNTVRIEHGCETPGGDDLAAAPLA